MNKFDNFGLWLGRQVLSHRLLTVFLSVFIVLSSAIGIKYIGFDANYRTFFSEENPQLKAWDELQEVYSKTDNAIFVLKPKGGEVFTTRVLEAVKEITERGWQLPFSTRVDSITNYQHTEANGDELVVADLVEGEPSELTPEELVRIKKIALNEPLLVNRIISDDADTTGVNIIFNFPEKSMTEVPTAVREIRKLLEDVRSKYPDIEIVVSGVVMMNNAFAESAQRDLKELVPIMYAVLLIAMVFFLRSVSATLAIVCVIAFSALTAMGLTGWLGISLTAPSATAPTIILTLAIADSIHIIVTMFKEMAHNGRNRHDAIVESMRINFQPVFLTSVTTAIGFLTLNFSDAPPFHDLGNITAIGVIAALFFSTTLLPVLLSVIPIRVAAKRVSRSDDKNSKEFMCKMSDFIVANHRSIFVILSIVVVFLALMIPRIEINDQFVQYFDEDIQFRPDTEFMMENLTGIYAIEYSLGAGREQGISDPAYLHHLENFANWLRSQPETVHVYSMADIFKRLNKNMHGDDERFYRIPDNKELAAQYLLLYEFSLPYGLDLNDRISVDKSATRLTATLRDMSTKEIRSFKERSESWLRNNTPEYMHTESTSPVVMFAYISKRNIDSMMEGNIVALVLISLCIMLALKCFRTGLISLIPNLIPAVMGFGIWSLLVGQVNMASAIIASVSLGIIVDDTVHFLSKYNRARKEKGLDARGAVRYAFATVGTALFITTMVLVMGFSILMFSGFEMNNTMGMMTAIVIACALVVDFFLLPPLLILLDKK